MYYIRSKKCSDFLPKSIDDIGQDFVEIDDLIGTIFGVKDNYKGRAGQRDVVIKSIKNIPIYNEIRNGQGVERYYLKEDINQFIKGLANYDSEYPIDHVFNYEGKTEKKSLMKIYFLFMSLDLQHYKELSSTKQTSFL